MSAEDHMDVGGDFADREFAKEEYFNEYGKYPNEDAHHTDEEGQMAEALAEGRPDSLDFLTEEEPKTAMQVQAELAAMADTLTKLEFEYVTALEKMEQAKKIYDEFRCVTLPNAFRMAGLLGVVTTHGARVTIERKYYCTPNKNEEDQKIMIDWLEKNGGKDLIKRQAIVDATKIPLLVELKIPHTQKRDVNTNSLKAWLKREVGENNNVANIKIEDVPPCMHFVCMDEAKIQM